MHMHCQINESLRNCILTLVNLNSLIQIQQTHLQEPLVHHSSQLAFRICLCIHLPFFVYANLQEEKPSFPYEFCANKLHIRIHKPGSKYSQLVYLDYLHMFVQIVTKIAFRILQYANCLWKCIATYSSCV